MQNERNASGMSNPGRLAAITSTGVLEVYSRTAISMDQGIFRSFSIGVKVWVFTSEEHFIPIGQSSQVEGLRFGAPEFWQL